MYSLSLTVPFFFMLAMAAKHTYALDVEGTWLTNRKDAHILIKNCGDGSPCGYIVWIDPQKLEQARRLPNQDPSANPIGSKVLWGFVRQNNGWEKGSLHNPEDGKTFRSRLRMQEDGNLKVTGCLGPFCISHPWTRVVNAPGAKNE
jgi:uncharacterized protein (DUF2147 family)